jgi:two-component system, sensor histidine kinase PdtaS
MRTRRLPRWAAYLITILVIVGVALLRLWLGADPEKNAFFFYFGVVMLASLLFDRHSGILAACVSVLAAAARPSVAIPGAVELRIELSYSVAFLIIACSIAAVIESLSHLYSRMHDQNNLLHVADERNRILLLDINHRVKNHLSAMAGLMNRSRRKVSDPVAKDILTDSANRLQVLSRVYDRLHLDQDDISATIDSQGFVEQLCDDLQLSLIGDRPIEIHTDVENVKIKTAKAMPIGLLVNEVITNSIKHGFSEDRSGNIWIALRPEDREHKLSISDDGFGGDPAVPGTGTGSRLIRSLADQLKGRYRVELNEHGGRTVVIHFPRINPMPA